MSRVTIDFETANPDKSLLEDGGAYRYAEDPCTEILCLCFKVNGGTVFDWTPEHRDHEALLRELADETFTMFVHHGDFEIAIWRAIMVPVYGFPDIDNARWDDTMATAGVKAMPLALENLAAVLGSEVQKDMEGRKIMLGMSVLGKDGYFHRDDMERVVNYCRDDVEAEDDAYLKLGRMPFDEWQAFQLHRTMTQRGLRLDLDYIAKAQKIVDDASAPLVAAFREITGLNPTQTQKVREWCKTNGAPIPNLTAETVAGVLGGSIDEIELEEDAPQFDLPDIVRQALEIRQLIGSSSIKKLKRMQQCVCADGRARGLSQFHGTLPGRATGRLFQPYNFPRGTLEIDGIPPAPEVVVDAIMTGDHEYVQMVLGPPIQAVVSGLRHAIVPDRGSVFLSRDFAGIQARIVLALAGHHDKTALMASGADIYCDMATQIYKRLITKKLNPKERQVGKNAVLGLGFQMGWRKFKLKYGKGLEDSFIEEVVRVYRKEWAPGVPKVWQSLQDASLRAIETGRPVEVLCFEYRVEDGWLTVRLPSGRKIWYRNPKRVLREMPWSTEDEVDIRPSWTYQVMKMGQWKTIDAFGGQLTENVVMGVEVDIQRHGWALAEANGFPIVHECYDELMAEVSEARADAKGFEQCLLDCPDWLRPLRVPVAVEGWEGVRYQK